MRKVVILIFAILTALAFSFVVPAPSAEADGPQCSSLGYAILKSGSNVSLVPGYGKPAVTLYQVTPNYYESNGTPKYSYVADNEEIWLNGTGLICNFEEEGDDSASPPKDYKVSDFFSSFKYESNDADCLKINVTQKNGSIATFSRAKGKHVGTEEFAQYGYSYKDGTGTEYKFELVVPILKPGTGKINGSIVDLSNGKPDNIDLFLEKPVTISNAPKSCVASDGSLEYDEFNFKPSAFNSMFCSGGVCNTYEAWVSALWNFAAIVAVPIATIIFIIAGILYAYSGGDPKKHELAKKLIYGALSGITILVLSKLIIVSFLELEGAWNLSLAVIKEVI